MQQDNLSFWTEIKSLEERLAKFPDSFCFAKLSEIYLKVGSVDDALYTARQGVAKHPAYLAGQRALAMACHARGFNDECLLALQRVTAAMPEDCESLKMLGRLFVRSGDREAGRKAFLTVLEFNPDDAESRLELDSLEKPGAAPLSSGEIDQYEDEEIIEDLEILEDDQTSSDFQFQDLKVASAPSAPTAEPQQDPLSTGTLAELYVSQGFIHKALDIYRGIQVDSPTNIAVSKRIAELELQAVAAEPTALGGDDSFEEEPAWESNSEPVYTAPVPAPESPTLIAPVWSAASELSPQGTADNALNTLEGWLNNIRRIRSCR